MTDAQVVAFVLLALGGGIAIGVGAGLLWKRK